ncbi:MAG: hypothetical protein KDA91_23750 [Planctomycetaceae bacterium]|nr:hypothetical protein [Planctomycetaceae bacterium]
MPNTHRSQIDDEALIKSIFTDELIRRDPEALRTVVEEMVARIVQYDLEIGSGEDFIQWFRWTSPSEVRQTSASLRSIGAAKSAGICEKAIQVAFPSGIPESLTAYKEHLYALQYEPAHKKQLQQLVRLAKKQLPVLNETTTCLAMWIREHQ